MAMKPAQHQTLGKASAPRKLRIMWAVLAALLVSTFIAACEPGGHVSYENKTGERLFVELDERGPVALPPGKTTKIFDGILDDERVEVVVTDEQGCVVLRRTLMFGELRRNPFTIMSSDLPPLHERTNCPKQQ